MQDPIQVRPLILAAGHKSFELAVAAAGDNVGNMEALSRLNGQVVSGFQFDGVTLVISFHNSLSLVVFPDHAAVQWQVLSDPPALEAAPFDDTVTLEFPSTLTVVWEWRATLEYFVGKELRLAPSDQYLFVILPESGRGGTVTAGGRGAAPCAAAGRCAGRSGDVPLPPARNVDSETV